MSVRHAAALALVGWYLMVPPYTTKLSHFTYNPSAPLSQWKIDEGFDSAAKCKIERSETIQKAEQAIRDPGGAESAKARLKEWLDFYSHAECIASDDPRLIGN